jgi:predicted glycosyltransferase involved in capsule biosynthesis
MLSVGFSFVNSIIMVAVQGVVKRACHTYINSMTREEKILVTAHMDQVFRGQTIRQTIPVCECGKVYEEKELCEAPAVFFRDVDVFGKTFTLIEPLCPVCKRRIQASFNILN